MRTWTPLATALCSLLVLGACAGEDEIGEDELGEETGILEDTDMGLDTDVGYADWDVDRDDRLASNEFTTWAGDTGLYDEWNAMGGEGLEEDEFSDGIFGLWDEDDDARLTEDEWQAGADGWGDDWGTWGDWDADGDGYLTEDEYATGFGTTGVYDQWDVNQDDMITEDEYGEGLFDLFDENDDTYVDQNEWGTWYDGWDWGV